MIFDRPLTLSEKKSSQRNYKWFNVVNGASYMCLGETILILLAVKLKCSDSIVAILGSMQFVGYILLPLGKWMTARSGAAGSQAQFWVYRNIAVLIVAMAIPVSLWFSKELAVILLLGGSFLFYGFRAAGVVMSQPLIGEICDTDTRGRFIATCSMLFYLNGFLALVIITGLLKLNSGIGMLFLVIIAGSVLGITSSRFVRNIHESNRIMLSAREPIRNKIVPVLKQQIIRRQIIAGMICYLAYMLTVPTSMLALKRGYGVSDTHALFFALAQFGAAAAAGYIQSKLADRFTTRNMLLFDYYCFLAAALLWVVTPNRLFAAYSVLPFLLGSYGCIGIINSLSQYYLETVPKKLQIVSSMIIAVCMGVFSGLLSMMIGSSLLKLSAYCNSSENPLTTYRLYFFFLCILLPLIGIFVHRLKQPAPKV